MEENSRWLSIPAHVVRREERRDPTSGSASRRTPMGQYVVLIYEDEKGWSDGDPAVIEEGMKAHNQFAVDAGEKLRGGQALQPTATATTIHKDGSGGFAVTDGPFVETKEALGGFYIIEAADLDEAIALAKKVPAPFGGVEVRPVMVFE
jgi:hypothetical protein